MHAKQASENPDNRISIPFVCILILIAIAFLLTVRYYAKSSLVLIPLGILCVLSIIVQLRKCRQGRIHGVAGLFGITRRNEPSNRLLSYDLLRVIAIICAICTHILQIDLSRGAQLWHMMRALNAAWIFFLICNPLYIMISAALLFPPKEEKTGTFYYKHISKVLLPMVIYYVWYYWQGQWRDLEWSDVPVILKNLLTGETADSPNYWFLYALLFIYLVVPFLRKMFSVLSYRMKTQLAVVCLLFLAASVFSSRFDLPVYRLAFGDWLSVAILGYWCSLPETRRYDLWIILAGVLSTAILIACVIYLPDPQGLCANASPVMVCIANAVMALCFRFCGSRRTKAGVIQFLSKYNYGTILIHWWALNWVVAQHFILSMYHGFGGVIEFFLVLGISLAIAVMLDNMILPCIQQALDAIAEIPHLRRDK